MESGGDERDRAAIARSDVPCCDEFLLLEMVAVPESCVHFRAHHS